MRCKLSDPILLFNGKDGEWQAIISQLDKKSVEVTLTSQQKPQIELAKLVLFFAPIKFGRIDYLVEKATELGVTTLQPVMTDRTIVSRLNIERLTANAIEAAEQSERLSVPEIREPMRLDKVLSQYKDPILWADETGGGVPFLDLYKKKIMAHALLIGPEGGFSSAELVMLKTLPYVTPISLGPRILRADTAALAALSCWQALLGDWNHTI